MVSKCELLEEVDAPQYKLVLVKWYDACGGGNNGWSDLGVLQDTKPVPCYTVGFLLLDGTMTGSDGYSVDYIVVCPHLLAERDGENDDRLVYNQGDGEIAIPKSWVVELKYL